MDGGAWRATVHEVTKSWTRLSDFTSLHFYFPVVAQRVKHLPVMRETWVPSLGREDPLEKEKATHSGTLAWKIPWTEKPGRLHGMAKSWTRLSNITFTFFFLSGGFPPMDQLWLRPLGSNWLLTLSACSTGFHSYTHK